MCTKMLWPSLNPLAAEQGTEAMRSTAHKLTKLLDAVVGGQQQAAPRQAGAEQPPTVSLWAGPRLQWKPDIPALREQTR